VRVIDDQNAQLGVLPTREAIDIARDRDLDLILVAPQAQPPVCRIMDYGKYKYEKSKREKQAHKKGAATELKMVRLHPQTSEHDRNVVIRHSERFLREGHKVRAVCQFKGRENAYPEIGRKQLEKVAAALAEISTIEGFITKQGRDMTMNLTVKPGVKPLPKVVKESWKAKGQAAPAPGEPEVEEPDEEEKEFEALQARLEAERKADAPDDEEDDTDDDIVAEDGETEDEDVDDDDVEDEDVEDEAAEDAAPAH
jgi:translation initiation factor IF-3